MPLEQKNLTLSNFSGGIVDNYIQSDDTHFKTIENFDITSFGKLRLRNGFTPVFDSNFVSPITGMNELSGRKIVTRTTLVNEFDEVAGTVTPITKPNAGDILTNTQDLPVRMDPWLSQLILSNGERQVPKKVYIDDTNTLLVEELGMPGLTEDTLNPITHSSARGGASTHQYIYAYFYSKTHKVGVTEFKIVSDIIYKSVSFSYQVGVTNADPDPLTGLSTVTVTNIPVLDQVSTDVFLSNAVVEVFRSYNGGAFLKVNEVTNGTTTFTDSMEESVAVNNNVVLYAPDTLPTGYHQPPKCKYVSVANNTAYFGNCEEYGDIVNVKSNRVYQSIPGIVNSSNPDFFLDFNYEIKGLSSFKKFPIVFTSNAVYRIEGAYTSTTASEMRSVVIADKVGCVSDKSIVKTPEGLIWCGDDGIYFTDGFRIKMISLKINETYSKFVDTQSKKDRISGSYNKDSDLVYFTLGKSGLENDRILVYSLITNAFWFYTGQTLNPVDVYQSGDNYLYYTDSDGYIYKESKATSNDYVKVTNDAIANWFTDLTFKLITSAVDMGGRFLRKVTSRVVVETVSSSDISVGLYSINDDGKSSREMKHIVSKGNWVWGDSGFVWGNPDSIWRKRVTLSSTRRFPRGTTRCRMKQIGIEPTKVVVYKSDLYGQWSTLVHNAATGDLTITLPVGGIFPVDIIKKEISFGNDNYLQKYTIINRVSDTEIIAKAVSINTLATSKDWQISGYITNQSFEIESLSIKYSLLDNIEGQYSPSSEGGNA